MGAQLSFPEKVGQEPSSNKHDLFGNRDDMSPGAALKKKLTLLRHQ